MKKLAQLSLLVSALSSFAGVADASVRFDLASPDAIAALNHQVLPARVVDLLYREAVRGEPTLTREAVTARLIENRLIGDYAQKTYGDDVLFDNQRVGFKEHVELENQLVSTAQMIFGKALDQAVRGPQGVESTVVATHLPVAQDMDAVFGVRGRPLLSYDLTPAQLEAARAVPLLDYRFAGGPVQSVSLADIYDYQNVQGRVMLFNRDANYMAQQAHELLERRFILDWLDHKSGLASSDVAFLRQAIADKARRDELTHYMGLDQNLDEATPYLKQMAASVTPQEVQDYYHAHRDAFLQIDKVKARHIAVGSEDEARAIYANLQQGGDFSALARQHSLSDASSGGDLGWVLYPKGQAVPWLAQLAFAQRPGVASRPVRAPSADGERWEIVLVDDRVQSYLPADSDAVRFAASESLAHIKAETNFARLRQQLLAGADIQANPQLLKADALKL